MQTHDLTEPIEQQEAPKREYNQPRLSNFGGMINLTQFNQAGFVSDGDPFNQGYS